MRGSLRAVEEAITAGDGKQAREALSRAEPEIMRAAQEGRDSQKFCLAEGFPSAGAGSASSVPDRFFKFGDAKRRPCVAVF